MKELKVGDKVVHRNVGFGLTSYEGPDTVTDVSEGKIFTNIYDVGLEWDASNEEWFFDAGLGLRTSVVDPADPAAVAYLSDDQN